MPVPTNKKKGCFYGLCQVLLLWSYTWTKVTAKLTNTRATAGGLPRDIDWRYQESMADDPACATAVLISGQKYRFIYRDSALQKGLDRLLGKDNTFDIHAVIGQTGRVTNVWTGRTPEFPPYSTDIPDIFNFFRNNTSAKHVNITLIQKDVLLNDLQQLRNLTLDHEAQLTNTSAAVLRAKISHGHGGWSRFEANTMMLHLRHLAYIQAMSSELDLPYKYQAFLVLREDNTFLGPNLGPCVGCAFNFVNSDCQALNAPPVLLADLNCVWGARLSDKIFFSNRAAARLIWRDSRKSHIEHLASFIGPMLKQFKRGIYPIPMQTESWIDEHLEESNIQLFVLDFQRIDKRYVTKKNTSKQLLCAASDYKRCSTWAQQENVPTCE